MFKIATNSSHNPALFCSCRCLKDGAGDVAFVNHFTVLSKRLRSNISKITNIITLYHINGILYEEERNDIHH